MKDPDTWKKDVVDDMPFTGWKDVYVDKIMSMQLYRRNTPEANTLKDEIKAGRISMKVNEEKQNKHIKDSGGYITGRSYLTIPLEEIQQIVNEQAGSTGLIVDSESHALKKKEKITCDKIIGKVVDRKNNEETPTHSATIHYSKTGAHIVPRREDKR